MQGRTHLVFGTAASVAVVALGGIGLGAHVARHHTILPITAHRLSFPSLQPAAWLALVLAGALGSVLPDIDQPGSFVTRVPERQGRALQRWAYSHNAGSLRGPLHLTVDTLAKGTGLASALLGSTPGAGSRIGRFLLLVLSIVFALAAAMVRWLPPEPLLLWTVQTRDALALVLTVLALAALLLRLGGVAGLVNRLPGHHRGWTHAPPIALALALLSMAIGPILLPNLPGIGAAFATGYISHLAADALTIRGIPLCWPGTGRPSLHLLPGPLRVRTGGAGEAVFNLCWPVVLVVLITW